MLTCECDFIVAVVVNFDFEVNIVIPNCLRWLSLREPIIHHIIVEDRDLLVLEELE